MKKIKLNILLAVLFLSSLPVFAFDDGFVLGMKVLFSGSATRPHISNADLKTMGADFLKGNVGFITSGEFDLTYIFDAKKYFNLTDTKSFGGLGFQTFIGIGQGFSGQISGMGPISVFVNVYYTPVVTCGFGLKGYFLSNRMVVSLGLGTRIIADPTPNYDMYNSDPATLKGVDGVGTMIVTKDMMKKMNAFGFLTKFNIEYVQPILNTTEMVLGAFCSYCVYKPKYVAMPPALEDAAKATNFDAKNTPLKSFYLNSLDFGVSLGFNFKVS